MLCMLSKLTGTSRILQSLFRRVALGIDQAAQSIASQLSDLVSSCGIGPELANPAGSTLCCAIPVQLQAQPATALKLVSAASLRSVDMSVRQRPDDQHSRSAFCRRYMATFMHLVSAAVVPFTLLQCCADDDRHGSLVHESRHCSTRQQLQPGLAVASPSRASFAADLIIACAEACRRPVLLHALAQLRRQRIFPVHHAGAVAVRASCQTPALCVSAVRVQTMHSYEFHLYAVRNAESIRWCCLHDIWI